MPEGLAFIANLNSDTTLLFLSVFSMYFVHACGVRVVLLEHGALGF